LGGERIETGVTESFKLSDGNAWSGCCRASTWPIHREFDDRPARDLAMPINVDDHVQEDVRIGKVRFVTVRAPVGWSPGQFDRTTFKRSIGEADHGV
jgi:hypothetical protein